MWTTFAVAVIFVALSGVQVEAADCCAAYDDPLGTHHDTQLCENYCCLALYVDYVQCCDDPARQVPSYQRTDACLVSWMQDNFWMLIVGGVGIVIFVSLLCVCCCRRRVDHSDHDAEHGRQPRPPRSVPPDPHPNGQPGPHQNGQPRALRI